MSRQVRVAAAHAQLVGHDLVVEERKALDLRVDGEERVLKLDELDAVPDGEEVVARRVEVGVAPRVVPACVRRRRMGVCTRAQGGCVCQPRGLDARTPHG